MASHEWTSNEQADTTSGTSERTGEGWSTSDTGATTTQYNSEYKDADGTTTVFSGINHYDEDGDYRGSEMNETVTDDEGTVTEETRIVSLPDGTSQEQTKREDGSVTTTKYDKEGNVISTETVDADGNPVDPPKQDKGEFWDVDIIYGGPDGKIGTDDDMFLFNMDQDQFAKGGMEMLAHTMSQDAAEAFVDNFDFM